jgi:hypothetical protein
VSVFVYEQNEISRRRLPTLPRKQNSLVWKKLGVLWINLRLRYWGWIIVTTAPSSTVEILTPSRVAQLLTFLTYSLLFRSEFRREHLLFWLWDFRQMPIFNIKPRSRHFVPIPLQIFVCRHPIFNSAAWVIDSIIKQIKNKMYVQMTKLSLTICPSASLYVLQVHKVYLFVCGATAPGGP